MKKLFKASNLLFIFLTVTLFFLLGMILAGVSGVAKNQGLAGGAIIFGYGLISAFGALVISVIMIYFIQATLIIRINKILAILWFLGLGLIAYKFLNRETKKNDPPIIKHKATTAIVQKPDHGVATPELSAVATMKDEMGLGLFIPNFHEASVLYFYGTYKDNELDFLNPTDSITFGKNQHGQFEIKTAPPWLVPEHLKMDYGILFFKVIEIGENFYKVVGNKSNNYLSFVAKDAGIIKYWPDFLLGVSSVEFLEDGPAILKEKPLDHASEKNIKFEFMSPISIKGDWMKVKLSDNNYNILGESWIKWREKGKLKIKYSILS